MMQYLASTPASPMLCISCRGIFQNTFRLSVPYPGKYERGHSSDSTSIESDVPTPHQASPESLHRAASQNCFFCSAVSTRIPDEITCDISLAFTSYYLWTDDTNDRDTRGSYGEEDVPIKNYIRLSFALGSGPDTNSRSILLNYILFLTSELKSYMIDESESTFAASTASTKSWEIAQNWIQKCMSSHSRCKRGVGIEHKKTLPTRLLEISKVDQQVVYLRNTSELLSDIEYTTLSHCWGTSRIFTLTSNSEEELRNGLDISKLSRTFQEAITVSLRLGFKYLWIDSLCIFQDSRLDWEFESAMMGYVYRGSACNIAATGSSDGTGGLFHSRNPVEILPVSIETFWSAGNSKPTFNPAGSLNINGVYTIYEKDFWHEELSSAPLLTRGWVVQERVLSPRILHFSTRQLLWECLESDASEVYPSGRPDKYLTKNILSLTDSYKPVKPLIDASVVSTNFPEGDKFEIWKRLVNIACGTSLTKSSDKLASLSGVAKSMLVPAGDQYLAGIWKSYIFGYLFWIVPDGRQVNGQRSERIVPYVAPSWSWASLNAVIDYRTYSLYSIFIKLVDVGVVLATSDPTGQILSGFLRVTGPVISLRIADAVRVSSDIDRMDMKALRELDTLHAWGYYDQEEGQLIYLNNEPIRASLKPDLPFDPDAMELFFLATEFDWSFRMSGMILKYSEKDDGSFERIGYLSVNNNDSQKKWDVEYETAWPLLEPFVREIVIG